MNSNSSTAIILSRINYGESDRILTLITEEGSKTTLMSKGVRKLKSKLAGGIELFCESEIVYMGGRSKMGTLVSARVKKQYGNIVKDIDKTMFGYEILKLVSKITEDQELEDYYSILKLLFEALNDPSLDINIVKTWTYYHLLELTGHQPNLESDESGKDLSEDVVYDFDISNMSLVESQSGQFTSRHIKFLRLVSKASQPKKLSRIKLADNVSTDLVGVLSRMIKFNL